MQMQTPAQKTDALALQLKSRQSDLQAMLPAFMRANADKFMQFALTALQKPEIANCSPESKLAAIFKSAQLGIPADGRRGALIPRKGVCCFDPMYPGLVELARRSNEIKDVVSDVVYRHEIEAGGFENWNDDKGQHFLHKPKRGNAVQLKDDDIEYAYARMRWADGHWTTMVCDRPEIERAKARSQAPQKAWTTDFPAMAKKTAVKRLMNLAPLPEEVQQVLSEMDAEERADLVESETIASQPLGASAFDQARAGLNPQLSAQNATHEALAPVEQERWIGGIRIDLAEPFDTWADEKLGGKHPIMSGLSWRQISMDHSEGSDEMILPLLRAGEAAQDKHGKSDVRMQKLAISNEIRTRATARQELVDEATF